MQHDKIGRRAACAALLGAGGSLLAAGAAPAQPEPRPRRRGRSLPVFANGDFYDAAGKFNQEAAKKAYLALCRWFGYPANENFRKNLSVTDFALGRFTEVGLGCCVWVDDKKGNYCTLEIVLLPNQMIPEHWHVALEAEGVPAKMESWLVRYGATFTYGEGEPAKSLAVKIPEKEKAFVTVRHETPLRPGEVTGISHPLEKHWQQAGPEGAIITEISTYHAGAAVKFTDPAIKF
jgi:hypothetical protein